MIFDITQNRLKPIVAGHFREIMQVGLSARGHVRILALNLKPFAATTPNNLDEFDDRPR